MCVEPLPACCKLRTCMLCVSCSKSHVCLKCEAKALWEGEMLNASHGKLFPEVDWGEESGQSEEDLESIEKTITRVQITKAEYLTATILAKGPGETAASKKAFQRRLVQQSAEAASAAGSVEKNDFFGLAIDRHHASACSHLLHQRYTHS